VWPCCITSSISSWLRNRRGVDGTDGMSGVYTSSAITGGAVADGAVFTQAVSSAHNPATATGVMRRESNAASLLLTPWTADRGTLRSRTREDASHARLSLQRC
jgi:hypothetical protein